MFSYHISAGHEIDDSSEEESEEPRLVHIDDEDKEDLPVFLWRPGQTTDALGSWEKHTKVYLAGFTKVLITQFYAKFGLKM